jgi:hypothetical protein
VINADNGRIRPLLDRALEHLGYVVVSDEPLVAKRGGRGWSGSSMSYDVRDYPTQLAIMLKPFGDRATMATFDYSLANPMMTRGDKATLEREAEAVIALAIAGTAATMCATCGTDADADSRFCRTCGAATLTAPAELEVLRQTAETHAGYRGVLIGTVGVVLSFLTFTLILALKGAMHLTPAVLFSLMWAIPSLLSLLFGARRLRRALTPQQMQDVPQGSKSLSAVSAGTLPAPTYQIPPSIAEGTTELLVSPPRERAAVPIKRKRGDTSSLS